MVVLEANCPCLRLPIEKYRLIVGRIPHSFVSSARD
jgi:hypothetical protein